MLHDLRVAGVGEHRETAVGEQVEHLGGMIETDEVAVADHEQGGGADRSDFVSGPAGEVVHDRLHALEEREEIIRVRRHRVVVGVPFVELLLGRQPRVILLGRGDLRVIAVGADVRGSQHDAADLVGVA